MKKNNNTAFIILLFSFLILSWFRYQSPKRVNATCYENQCIAWGPNCEECGGYDWKRVQYCNSCCYEYGDVEVPCPCDDSCDGSCTTTCPAGQTKTVSGPLCAQALSSCSYSNDCGDPCSYTGARCYLPETNTATPPQPASITIEIDEDIYPLSLDSENPTKVKRPLMSVSTTFSLPVYTPPPLTTRGVGYYFRTFVDGDPIFSSPTPTAKLPPDPDTDPNLSNERIFDNSDTLLNGGDTGKLAGYYYTFDKCDYTVKNGTILEGFFTVDNTPEPPTPPPSVCDPNVETCDKYDYLPELGTLQTTRGCESTDYVGLEINNPLSMALSLTDVDGNDEIEGLIVWFQASGGLPSTMDITESNTGVDSNNFGLLIRKGTDWNDTTIYQSNGNSSWVEVEDNQLKDSLGLTSVSLSDLAIDTVTNPSVDFTFKLQFHSGEGYTAIPATGDYQIYAQGLDTFQIYDDTTEVNRLSHLFDFGVDLTNPTVESTAITVENVREATLSWTSTDTDSGIMDTIINGFVSGGTEDIQLINDGNTVDIPSTHTSTEIGYYNDPYSLSISGGSDNDILINIGNNDIGSIDTYVTSYDYACNYAGESEQITLEPWTATQGGFFYSKQGVQTSTKDISETEIDTFLNFTKDNIRQGTELLSSRSNYYYQLINPTLGTVAASLVYDSNEAQAYWFTHLKQKFEEQKLTATMRALGSPNDTCNDDEYCYYQGEADQDIVLNLDDYTCTGYKLIISEADITIDPKDQDSAPSTRNTGCIYLAKEDIIIRGGEYLSDPDVEYDYMEGFFIAEQQVNILSADTAEDIRDGLEIKGGLVALGTNTSDEAISVNRNLRLYNLLYPTLLVNYDFKYGNIAETFFGTEASLYKQELGFKNI